MRKFSLFLVLGMLMAFQVIAQHGTLIVPENTTFKYLDDGSDQGKAWRAPSFNDANWKTGKAQVKHDYSPGRGQFSMVNFSPKPSNTPITTYFRKTIQLKSEFDYFLARVKKEDGVVMYVNGAEVYRRNLPDRYITYRTKALPAPAGTEQDDTFIIDGNAFKPGRNVIAVEIHQAINAKSDPGFALMLEGMEHSQGKGKTKLLPFKSTWKYLDNGSDQGTAWRAPGFSDDSWKSGRAILGYGNPPYNDRGEATRLSYGPDPRNTYTTAYFRKTITLSSAYHAYIARIRRDDGVVVYVNGVEVFRNNMPRGPINYKTLASYAMDNGMRKLTFPIKASAFVPGKNVIAVEVHNISKTDTDMTFDLELKGYGKPVDRIPPVLLSLARQHPAAAATTATSVIFRAIFSEAVSGVDASDFSLALGGTANGRISSAVAVGTSGNTYDITIDKLTGTGTLGLNLKASNTGIIDPAGNALIGGGFSGQAYSIRPADLTAPTLLSLARQSPAVETTTATSVVFRATFSEPVTGVDAADFSLALTGQINASISTVVPVGTDRKTYDITVNTITGSGNLGLNLKASGTGIVDLVGNVLSIGFTGQVYLIREADQTPPSVVSLNRHTPSAEATTATSVVFRLLFSEAVSGVDAADFSLALSGTARGAISGVSASGTDGKTYDITVNSIGGTGNLGLNLKASGTAIVDRAGNGIQGGFTGQTFAVRPADQTPPSVVSLNRHTPSTETTIATSVVFRILFSEAVSGVDAADFSLALTGLINASISTVVPVGTDRKTYDITVNTITGSGNLGLNLKASGTAIVDGAGNSISGGFTGQVYLIREPDRTPPSVVSLNRQTPSTETTSATSVVFRILFSEGVSGVDAADFSLALSGTASGAISGVSASGTDGKTYDITINNIGGSGNLGLNLKASGTAIVDGAGNSISGGFTGQVYLIRETDGTSPTVVSLRRQTPNDEVTTSNAVIFRIIFSEAVSGVDVADFSLALSGTVNGNISTVAAVTSDNDSYNITVNNITGSGRLGLNLKASGTGITDGSGNSISGGFTGESYLIEHPAPTPGFASITMLTPQPAQVDATKEKHQGKVFRQGSFHWAVFADPTGTHLWRLDGTTWTKMLLISTRNGRADVIQDNNLVHILLYGGSANSTPAYGAHFRTLEYVAATNEYRYWSGNRNMEIIPLDPGIETASLAKDGNGLLWIVNAGTSEINARWSAAPYSTWSAPVQIVSGITEDDIAAAVYLPAERKLGVFWSNQNTRRFGFITHADGAAANLWSADERPGYASAREVGSGMADDHFNMKVSSNGTLYTTVKTSYDTPDEAEIGLLVRQPGGTWSNLYTVANNGRVSTEDPTLPIVLVNERIGRIRVVYTSRTNGGDILYRESEMSNIAFGGQLTLIAGINNNAASIHGTFSDEVVILASNASEVVGVLASDAAHRSTSLNVQAVSLLEVAPLTQAQELLAYPNPFSTSARLTFALENSGDYTLTLFESISMQVVFEQKGQAEAGQLNTIELDASNFSRGFYIARLVTADGVQTLRLVIDK